MHSCSKIVLKGSMPSTNEVDQHKDNIIVGPSRKVMKITTSSTVTNYSILDQLQWMNAQIKIFELLKILPTHRKILDKSLNEACVPRDLDLDRFQSMVGHLTSPYY